MEEDDETLVGIYFYREALDKFAECTNCGKSIGAERLQTD